MDEEISYYEDLLRASVDWTWETDRDCRIVRLSSGFDSTLGTAGRTLIGQSLVAIASHTEDANAKLAQRLEEVLSARRPFRHIPLMVRLLSDVSPPGIEADGMPMDFLSLSWWNRLLLRPCLNEKSKKPTFRLSHPRVDGAIFLDSRLSHFPTFVGRSSQNIE